MRWSAQIHTKLHVHRITQEIPRRAPVFGYGLVTLYEAIFHSLHLTFALPRRAPTTPVDKSTGLLRDSLALSRLSSHLRLWSSAFIMSSPYVLDPGQLRLKSYHHSPIALVDPANKSRRAILPRPRSSCISNSFPIVIHLSFQKGLNYI
jgi:hypothetical protein